jgi:hypothetical protein
MEVYSIMAGAVVDLCGDPDCSLYRFESPAAAGEEVAGQELPVCGVMRSYIFRLQPSATSGQIVVS